MTSRRQFTLAAAALPLGLQAAMGGHATASTTSPPWAHDFIEALWRLRPDSAVYAGRFEFVPELGVPDAAQRQQETLFWRQWRTRLAAVAPGEPDSAQRPGFALKAFHERLLSFGSAPVREIAKAML